MNPFNEIIHGMDVHSSIYAKFELHAPWGVGFDTGNDARLVIISKGSCWLNKLDNEAPIQINAGTCLIIQSGVTFSLTDAIGRDIIACETLFSMESPYFTTNNEDGNLTELISGRFSFDSLAAEPLFLLLQPLVVLKLKNKDYNLIQSTLNLIGLEASLNENGSDFVIKRLMDTLFIQTLRALCHDESKQSKCWLAGLNDKRIALVIHSVHSNLSRHWTVEDMAREAGLSRSSFAAQFKSIIGETPLNYLTNWRIYRAKILLSSTNDSLIQIANLIGYDSDISLNRVFRNKVGITPGQWRKLNLKSS